MGFGLIETLGNLFIMVVNHSWSIQNWKWVGGPQLDFGRINGGVETTFDSLFLRLYRLSLNKGDSIASLASLNSDYLVS